MRQWVKLHTCDVSSQSVFQQTVNARINHSGTESVFSLKYHRIPGSFGEIPRILCLTLQVF